MPPLRKILHLNRLRYAAALHTLGQFSGARSKAAFLRHVVRNCSFTQVNPPTAVDAPLIALRVKALGGRTIFCRSGLSDLGVVFDTFVGRYHLPPPGLTPVRAILDLGSNIGLTMAHFAVLYPEAVILGAELDHANSAICRRNTGQFGPRVQVVHRAVWHQQGEVPYGGVRESGYAILSGEAQTPVSTVRTITVPELLAQLGTPVADFVKMDIEGAELEVLRHAGDWIHRVRCLKVEVHPGKTSAPYSVAGCVEELERFGMLCTVDTHHHACVIARAAASAPPALQ